MDVRPRTPMTGVKLRRLAAQDLDSVVMLDAANIGRSRRAYFERRLKAALAQPELHVQFAAERGSQLIGFMMARKLLGQFGRALPALRLESMGVEPGEQGHGMGAALLSKLESEAKKLGIPTLVTTASWRSHAILQFFDHCGFELGHNLVIDCPVGRNRIGAHEGDKVLAPEHHSGFSTREVDYSGSSGNDFDALARGNADVRTLKAEDIDDIIRIDERVTGRRREDYIRQLVQEALTDSAVRVSLVARTKENGAGGIATGFVAARTDFGDYGRAEPVAILDTIDVDPDYAHHGVGHALLSQLFVNLKGLRVERVETVVARENFRLLAFFYDIGFDLAERLAFSKRVA